MTVVTTHKFTCALDEEDYLEVQKIDDGTGNLELEVKEGTSVAAMVLNRHDALSLIEVLKGFTELSSITDA